MKLLFPLGLTILCTASLHAQTAADLGAKIDALGGKIDSLAARVDRLEARMGYAVAPPARSAAIVPAASPSNREIAEGIVAALTEYMNRGRQQQTVYRPRETAPEPPPFEPTEPVTCQPAAVETYRPPMAIYRSAPLYAPAPVFSGACPNGQCGVRQRSFFRVR